MSRRTRKRTRRTRKAKEMIRTPFFLGGLLEQESVMHEQNFLILDGFE